MPYKAGPTKKRKEGIPFFFFFHGDGSGNGNLQIKEEEKNIEKKESWRMLKNLEDWGASEEEEEENTYRERGGGKGVFSLEGNGHQFCFCCFICFSLTTNKPYHLNECWSWVSTQNGVGIPTGGVMGAAVTQAH